MAKPRPTPRKNKQRPVPGAKVLRMSAAEFKARQTDRAPAFAGRGKHTKKPRKCPTEHQEQVALITWAATQPGLDTLFAIPNGGFRSYTTAKKLKAEGCKPGVSDLLWPCALHGWHGLWIEMKALDGTLTEDQEDWLRQMHEQGYVSVVAYGCAAAQLAIADYQTGIMRHYDAAFSPCHFTYRARLS